MLIVKVPEGCTSERQWILGTILGDFLGVEYQFHVDHVKNVLIQADGRTLELSDEFFQAAAHGWLEHSTMPKSPLDVWDTRKSGLDIALTDPRVPVLFGRGAISLSGNRVTLGLDVFGSAFFMLSRYEEVVSDTRDSHDRFPATASVAAREYFLDRPVVNEYVEILWACIHRLWPGMARRQHKFESWITADIDHPYSAGTRSSSRQLWQIGADLIVRRSPTRALRNARNYFESKRGNLEYDPYYPMLRWMMDINERAGNTLTFFIMAGATHPRRDNGYSLDEPVVRELLREIAERGHSIGLHPSYETYKNGSQIRKEVENLRRVLSMEGISYNTLGGRQHYLRWAAPKTARYYEAAGLNFDATLGYADQAGFRCGTCYEYGFYDVEERCPIPLLVRPLIVMEGTLFSRRYMNLDENSGVEIARRLEENCRLFNGKFSLLWHNSSFQTAWARDVYRELIK